MQLVAITNFEIPSHVKQHGDTQTFMLIAFKEHHNLYCSWSIDPWLNSIFSTIQTMQNIEVN